MSDPWFDEEVTLRHVTEGTIGHHVPGSDRIRIDLPNGKTIWKAYHEQQWIRQDDPAMRPMAPAQIARVCFEADRALCMVMGNHKEGRQMWEAMYEGQRASWIQSGPGEVPEIRLKLYAAIRGVLRELELRGS